MKLIAIKGSSARLAITYLCLYDNKIDKMALGKRFAIYRMLKVKMCPKYKMLQMTLEMTTTIPLWLSYSNKGISFLRCHVTKWSLDN